jgi:DNA-binding HxlR family transcriptional regulator
MKANASKWPDELRLAMIGNHREVPMIFSLLARRRRFSDLMRALTGVTQHMLTQQLREMARRALAIRTIYPQVPTRVEYSLIELGVRLRSVLDAMFRWGEAHGVPCDVAAAGR